MLQRNAYCALALLCFSSVAAALDVGFEGLLSVDASDNVTGANNGSEIEGQVGYGQFGVFGEQKGTKLRGAFTGEIYSQRRLDDLDSDFNAVTQFLGAAELQITPRSFSWYVGDILGSVRVDDGFQSIDQTTDMRRNVFATGPQFVYELDATSRVNARFLYVNQAQDDITLEQLYNSNATWEFDTDRGNTWGTSFGNIYTDNPESNLEGDFNRLSLAGYWRRTRGRLTYNASLGGTRYDTEDDSLNGVNARFSIERQMGPQTLLSVALTRDLRDQTLSTVQSLLDNGTGVQADGDGFFDETRIELRYGFTSTRSSLEFAASVGQSDFRLLADNTGFIEIGDAEDRTNLAVSAGYTRTFSPKTRMTAAVSLAQQDYDNRIDNTQSVLGQAQLIRRLSRSFEVLFGYRVNVSEGQRTRNVLAGDNTIDDIDSIENRATVALRWAPPSRASKDLTIELKSLLR